jgi:hypothetical protein
VTTRRQKASRETLLGRLWIPAVVLLVVGAATYGVGSVRSATNAISSPSETISLPATVVEINPKNVTYEVFGDLGSGGKVVYADLNSQPIEIALTKLPWSHSESSMSPSASLSLVTQVGGDRVGCRITVNGKVRDEQSVSHIGAAAACTVVAA